jgi:hypothetical protein
MTAADQPGEDALHDGVPAWLRGSLLDWLAAFFVYRDEMYYERVRTDRVREMERRLRIVLRGYSPEELRESLWRALQSDDEVFLASIDVALGWCDGSSEIEREGARLDALATTLTQGGSAWRVGHVSGEGWRLERRVADAAVAAARAAMSGRGRPAAHLGRAWHAMYGQAPSPGEAYDEAVKAVEAAAIPVICPNDANATLGRINGDLRSRPGDWTVALTPRNGKGVARLLGMLELLWGAQLRHGTPDDSVPVSAAPREAEAAVHLAVTLVHWFGSGAVRHV